MSYILTPNGRKPMISESVELDEGIETKKRPELVGKNSRQHHTDLKKSGHQSTGYTKSDRPEGGMRHSYYHPGTNTSHSFDAKGGKVTNAYDSHPSRAYANSRGGNPKAKAHGESIDYDHFVEYMMENFPDLTEKYIQENYVQVDEISAKTATNYVRKADAAAASYHGPGKVSNNRTDAVLRKQRSQGVTLAKAKLFDRHPKSGPHKGKSVVPTKD